MLTLGSFVKKKLDLLRKTEGDESRTRFLRQAPTVAENCLVYFALKVFYECIDFFRTIKECEETFTLFRDQKSKDHLYL